MTIFKGSATAIVTPFKKNGNVNYESFRKLIDFQIENGIKAIIFLGTTGEASTISQNEQEKIVKFAVEYVNRRVPVIVGAGSNSTEVAVEKSKEFESMGADALLHVTPYYNKCTQKGLIEHYTKIADSVNIPIILYNVPGRTGVNILPQTVEILSKHKNIVAIKEASGNMDQISEIIRLCDNDFAIYSGDDGLYLPVISIGGKGVISVISNILPKEMVELYENFERENISKCRDIQLKLSPLIRSLFIEVNPIPIKQALNLMGMNVGECKLPLTHMDEINIEKLKIEMNKFNLIN